MDNTEKLLVEDLIKVLNRHGYIGFIGTLAKHNPPFTHFTTMSMVAPGFDEARFKTVEMVLSSTVNTIFEVTEQSHEDVQVIDPDKLEQ